MFPEVHETAVEGVATFWADLPGPLTGTLFFGVGTRDEPVPLVGITHLIEHLVFRAIEPILVDHNGMVDHESVLFHATGEPADVVAYLNDLCRALATLGDTSDGDLAREKSVMHAERGSASPYPTAGLLTYRFGLGEVGNGNAHIPTIGAITAAELDGWSRTWFTRSNASLSFTGPVPEGLDLCLPDRAAPQHRPSRPVGSTPRLVESVKAGVALSLVVPTELANPLTVALIHELRASLRHDLGLIYSIDMFHTDLDTSETQIDLVLDPTHDGAARTLQATLSLIGQISSEGFSQAAIDRVRVKLETWLSWKSAAVAQHVNDLALGHLLGRGVPDPAELLARPPLSSRELTEAFRAAIPTLILACDEDNLPEASWFAETGLPLDDFEAWQDDPDEPRHRRARKGRVWRGARRAATAGMYATLTDEALKAQKKADTAAIRFDDIVLVGRHGCGCLAIVDSRGRNATLDPEDWRDGPALIEAFLGRVPAELVRAFPSH